MKLSDFVDKLIELQNSRDDDPEVLYFSVQGEREVNEINQYYDNEIIIS